MYAKLYSTIVDSSLMEEDLEVRYTFMMMLAICDMRGDIITTDVSLARKLNMPIDLFMSAINRLQQPDPKSCSPVHEGRRVIPMEFGRGYQIVNYEFYRNLRRADERREYMRDYMAKHRAEQAATHEKIPKHPRTRKQRLDAEDAEEIQKDPVAQKEFERTGI